MADDKDEVEFDLGQPEKKAEAQEQKVEVSEANEASGESADDVLADLKRQLEQERNLRMQAQGQAQQNVREANKALQDKRNSEMQLVSTAIETVTREQDMLKKQLSACMSAGDNDAAAEIQAIMSENAAKLVQMKMGKEAMEAAPLPKVEPVAYTPSDPVEMLASRLTPRSAEWVRKHPEYARNQSMYQKMVAAHNFAVSDGLTPDTDEYFRAVEGLLKVVPSHSEPESALSQASQPVKRSSPPAAPVSRGGSGNPRSVTLTREEIEVAEMMGMKKEDYYKHKMALKKEGRIN